MSQDKAAADPGGALPGEASSAGASPVSLSPPAETVADMTLAQVLNTPLGDLLRMLVDGERKPVHSAKPDLDLARQRASEALRAIRISRVKRL